LTRVQLSQSIWVLHRHPGRGKKSLGFCSFFDANPVERQQKCSQHTVPLMEPFTAQSLYLRLTDVFRKRMRASSTCGCGLVLEVAFAKIIGDRHMDQDANDVDERGHVG